MEIIACICQCCMQKYKIDIMIPDHYWKIISPKAFPGGLLCGKCIIDKLEQMNHGAFELRELKLIEIEKENGNGFNEAVNKIGNALKGIDGLSMYDKGFKRLAKIGFPSKRHRKKIDRKYYKIKRLELKLQDIILKDIEREAE